MDLKSFIYRSEVLQLYRQILRTIKHSLPKEQQQELIVFARDEFRLAQSPELSARRYSLSRGKREFEDWCGKLRVYPF